VLRQQINVLRRTAPKRLLISSTETDRYWSAFIGCSPMFGARWRSPSRQDCITNTPKIDPHRIGRI